MLIGTSHGAEQLREHRGKESTVKLVAAAEAAEGRKKEREASKRLLQVLHWSVASSKYSFSLTSDPAPWTQPAQKHDCKSISLPGREHISLL